MDFLFYAIMSAFFSAAAALSQKKVLFKTDALILSFLVAVITFVFLVPYFFTGNITENLDATALAFILVKTLLGSLAFLSVMFSIKNFELSSVLPVLIFTPALVAIAAYIFLGDSMSGRETAGMLLMLGGIFLLEIKSGDSVSELLNQLSNPKVKYIFFALILFTASSVLDKLLIGKLQIPPFEFLFFQQLIASVIFGIIIFIAYKKGDKAFSLPEKKLLAIIFAIAAFTIAYRFFYLKALQTAPVAIVLTIKRLSVIMAIAASKKLFNETYILRKTVAAVCIIAGGYFLIS